MTLACTRCGCLMLGPSLERDHAALWWHCPCCPHVERIDVAPVVATPRPPRNPHAVQHVALERAG